MAGEQTGRAVSVADQLIAEVPALRAFALSLTLNRAGADDLVQETVLKAWTKLDSFEEGTNLRAWLVMSLRNTFISMKRKGRYEVEDVDGAAAAQGIQIPEQEGAIELAQFRGALAKLPDEVREALVLVGGSGFSYEEAAAICSCPIGPIKSRVSRARRFLQRQLRRPQESTATKPTSRCVTPGSQGSIGPEGFQTTLMQL